MLKPEKLKEIEGRLLAEPDWELEYISGAGYLVIAEGNIIAGMDAETNRAQYLDKTVAEFIVNAPVDLEMLFEHVREQEHEIEHLKFLVGKSALKIAEYEHRPLAEARRWLDTKLKQQQKEAELGRLAVEEVEGCIYFNSKDFPRLCDGTEEVKCQFINICRRRAELKGVGGDD